MAILLAVQDLRVRYGPLEALHGVSLAVAEGEVAAVVGRNGAGKTSLLRAVAGQVKCTGGRISWQDGTDGTDGMAGTDLTRTTIARRAAAGILLVPDAGAVFRSLTVRENLRLFAGRAPLDVALDAFPHLSSLMNRRALLLSGGEQQMLALARALLARWRLLLVDELSHGLAPALADQLYAVLADLAAAHPDRAVVFAEPDAREALAFAHRVHVLRHGVIATSTTPPAFNPAAL
jgi:branched-chain amino acid transport system ATP-binding protein